MAADALGQRQPPGEQLDAALEEPQALLAHQLERLRPSSAGVTNGLPSRSPPIHEPKLSSGGTVERSLGVVLGERLLEVAVDPRDRLGQRRGEVDQAAADLVEHGQRDRPQLVGAPQLLDGRQQPPARVLRRRRAARSSSSRSTRNTRASLSIVVRRRASVGCAVITSRSSARSSSACSSSAVDARAGQRRDAPRASSRARGAGASRASRRRRRRTRSLSSARLMS